jgi:hypothetical protein
MEDEVWWLGEQKRDCGLDDSGIGIGREWGNLPHRQLDDHAAGPSRKTNRRS